MSYTIRHVPLRAARAFVRDHHRHLPAPPGGVIALGLWHGDALVGAAILGAPAARLADRRTRIDLTRLCVIPGHRNAASMLQGRARRVAQALGYVQLVTYTLPEEGGASLRAAGAQLDGLTRGGEWDRPSRQRQAAARADRKWRWAWDLHQPALHAEGGAS